MLAIVLNDLDGKRYAVEKPVDCTTLLFMQRLVGGLITLVSRPGVSDGLDLFVNDEGLYHPYMIPNFDASVQALQHLVGPAAFLRCDTNGETIGVTTMDLERLEVTDFISLVTYEAVRQIQIMEMFDGEFL